MKIVLATRNRAKAEEIRKMLEGMDITLLTLDDFPEIKEMPPEDGATFEANALIKARSAAKETGLPALADDSGLEVDFLMGRPGVFSARYSGPHATDELNNMKLLKELQRASFEKRRARFRCAAAFVDKGAEAVFAGALEGVIAENPAGRGGFGYDGRRG